MSEERGDGFSDLKVQSVAVQSCFTNNTAEQFSLSFNYSRRSLLVEIVFQHTLSAFQRAS